MLAQVVLSLSVVIVSGGDDRELARQIDEVRAQFGDAQPAYGHVISFRHGVVVRAQLHALATLEVERDRSDPWAAPDPEGAVAAALAILDREPGDEKMLVMSPSAFEIGECALRERYGEIQTWPLLDDHEPFGDACRCPSDARDVHHRDRPTPAELCQQLRGLKSEQLALELKIALTRLIAEPRIEASPQDGRCNRLAWISLALLGLAGMLARRSTALGMSWRPRSGRGTL